MILVTSHKSLLTASERRRVKLLSEKINLQIRKIISLEWDFEQEGRDYVGSTPLMRTLQKSLKMGQEECHGKTKEVQRRV